MAYVCIHCQRISSACACLENTMKLCAKIRLEDGDLLRSLREMQDQVDDVFPPKPPEKPKRNILL